MSEENVEIVRRSCEAWARGDFEVAFSAWHPDLEWDTTHFEDWLESTVVRGREEVVRFLTREWMGSWDSYDAGIDDVMDAGNQVVVLWWQRMTGRGSGVPVRLDSAQVVTMHNGQLMRIDNYTDRAEALEAAGLSE